MCMCMLFWTPGKGARYMLNMKRVCFKLAVTFNLFVYLGV